MAGPGEEDQLTGPGAPGTPGGAGVDAVRSQALEVARGWSPPDAPPSWALTAAIFALLADDEGLAGIAAGVPTERLPALVFAAAACYLIEEAAPAGLVDYFPVGDRPPLPLDAGFAPAFRAFCLAHRPGLAALCGTRHYQMNEVGRSTQVALALGVLGERLGGRAVALVDLGTGAGLGLHPDRYGYRLSDGRRFGDRTSPLQLCCEVRGPLAPPVPDHLPPIAAREGVDLAPVDLADPGPRRWLRACVPPEQASRARFDQAAAIAVAHPCPLHQGDAVRALPELLHRVPADQVPVVVDTYTAVFLTAEERVGLLGALAREGQGRDLAWISLDPLVPLGTEGRDSVQDLPVPPAVVADSRTHGVLALLGLVWVGGGHQEGTLLAAAHPSGTRITWLDPPTATRGT
ncbi:MAG TPA: DUF2332 domain-containing protein [Acidimicrobiales bacterium]|nr:DUF2332 domain-containing protein [Acidimicrobiales bacterium]